MVTPTVSTDPDRIVICSGFAQGLSLICAALRRRGASTLAIEEYLLPETLSTIRESGLRTRTLAVDGDGAATGRLGTADAALLTPAHQFPIGVPLAPARRTQAVEWAKRTGGLLVEDDYDGEFRYDRHPLGALQARAPDHVIYAGTVSKTLAPGLRIGWLVLPAGLVDEIAEAKMRADRQGSTFDQLTLAEFIVSGAYDRHIRRSRLAYRRRRDRLIATLQRRTPEVRVTGIAAGLHVLLELPVGSREDKLIANAAGRGLAIEGVGAYKQSAGARPPALVIGYGTPPDHAFTGALARLCAVLAEARTV